MHRRYTTDSMYIYEELLKKGKMYLFNSNINEKRIQDSSLFISWSWKNAF